MGICLYILRKLKFNIYFHSIIYYFTLFLLVKIGQNRYTFVPRDNITSELYFEINPTLIKKENSSQCVYDSLLKSEEIINNWQAQGILVNFSMKGLVNGSFTPEHCNPRFSVAIIVPFRGRYKNLQVFLPYMHNFLRKQNIHYKIYVVQQNDTKPFNKGALLNIGAKFAWQTDMFPCLILHDADLLPLASSNLHVCMNQPRHMSVLIDAHNYILHYETLVGGVLAIQAKHYAYVNGYSNRYRDWGGEDSDLADRMEVEDLKIVRFPPAMSTYTMMSHEKWIKSKSNLALLEENRRLLKMGKKDHIFDDGLNSVEQKIEEIHIVTERTFTLISVKTI